MTRNPQQALPTLRARIPAVGRVLAGNTFATIPVPYLTGLLVLLGTVLVVRQRCPFAQWRDPPSTLLIWGCGTVLVVGAWSPMDWDRYYLPVIAVVSVFAGAIGAPLCRRTMRGAPAADTC